MKQNKRQSQRIVVLPEKQRGKMDKIVDEVMLVVKDHRFFVTDRQRTRPVKEQQRIDQNKKR